MAGGRYPIEQHIEDKKRGIGRQKYPVVGKFVLQSVGIIQTQRMMHAVWVLTAVMVGVFINELVVNDRAQGTPISLKACCHFDRCMFRSDSCGSRSSTLCSVPPQAPS